MPASTSSCRAARLARARRSREDERVRVVELVVEEAAGRVPVLAGAGGYDTREVIQSAQADEAGRRRAASSRSRRTTTSRRRKGSSSTTARSRARSGLPIVVYNVPGRTGCNVDVATLVRLSAVPGHRRRQGSVGQHQRRSARSAAPCRRTFIVLSGDDALTLPLMAVGGRGLISVASQRGAGEMARMVELAERERLRGRAADPRAAAAADAW